MVYLRSDNSSRGLCTAEWLHLILMSVKGGYLGWGGFCLVKTEHGVGKRESGSKCHMRDWI